MLPPGAGGRVIGYKSAPAAAEDVHSSRSVQLPTAMSLRPPSALDGCWGFAILSLTNTGSPRMRSRGCRLG